jgi:ABC-type nickel/cobalt efflux system permease component RcnA
MGYASAACLVGRVLWTINEMWSIVRFLRHLPAKGSLAVPPIFSEEEEEHEKTAHPGEQPGNTGHEHSHHKDH